MLGEVSLGQRQELLDVAAMPGEQVTVPVTEDMQTIIVELEAQALVSFNNFLREASVLLTGGDLPDNLTITLTRQLLDESGMLVPGGTEELSPVEGRVSVSIDRETGQYFVEIADARLEDSAVYTMEVCSLSGTPQEMCVNASVTVFVLDGEFLTCVVMKE